MNKIILCLVLIVCFVAVGIVEGTGEISLEEWCLSEGENWDNGTCYVVNAVIREGEGTVIISDGEHLIVNKMRNGDHIHIDAGGKLTNLNESNNYFVYVPCFDPGCWPVVEEGQIDNYGHIYNFGEVDNDYWTGWAQVRGEGVINNMESGIIYNFGPIACGEVYPDEFRINNYGVIYHSACLGRLISCEVGGTGTFIEMDDICFYLPFVSRH